MSGYKYFFYLEQLTKIMSDQIDCFYLIYYSITVWFNRFFLLKWRILKIVVLNPKKFCFPTFRRNFNISDWIWVFYWKIQYVFYQPLSRVFYLKLQNRLNLPESFSFWVKFKLHFNQIALKSSPKKFVFLLWKEISTRLTKSDISTEKLHLFFHSFSF